ncbi:MAG: PAS domain S-box protein, partial [Burkholderiales bacterium]|nr:PAS domain S-box protein [Burkholderiales bacterium]
MDIRSLPDKHASNRLRTTMEMAELPLQESELHKSAIMESALDCIIAADHQSRIIDFNPAAEQTFGYSRAEVIGKTLPETIIPPAWREAHERGMARYLTTGEAVVLGKRFEITAMRADGSEFPIELAITPTLIRDQPLFIAYLRDISLRKQSEQKIARLTNLYAALSESNEAIVRGADRDSLFRDICRIAVEYGQFAMSWIGLIDPAARQLVLAASSGDDHDVFKTLPWPLDLDEPMGRGPAATACRENRPCICNDIGNDPNTLPWRTAAALAGFRATASFPIRQHNEVIGVLGLYATEVGFFDAQLSDLLQKMAASISLALDNVAHEAKRRAVAKALYESEARYRQLVDMSPEAILVCDDG